MIFGDSVQAASTTAPADWIARARRGASGTVGSLVPNGYKSYLRLRAPEPDVEDWWSDYRRLFEVVAAVGALHTSCPERAWFAVWEGHGFTTFSTHLAWNGPLDDDVTRAALDEQRARLREDAARLKARVQSALDEIPRFELPDRAYYLLVGPVAAVAGIEDPSTPGRWHQPDLVWPDDRRWFVATDVDFWSLYVGGDGDLISGLAAELSTPTEPVALDQPLEIED